MSRTAEKLLEKGMPSHVRKLMAEARKARRNKARREFKEKIEKAAGH
jgi:hypothetical protein